MSPWTAAALVAATDAALNAAEARHIRTLSISRETQHLLTEIDDVIRPAAPEFAETLVGSLQSAVTTLRAVLADDAPTGDELAGLLRFLGATESSRLPRTWMLSRDPRPGDVPDLTRGTWPSVCQERWVTEAGPTWICTRIANHTGRHAAAGDSYVCAVWEQDVAEALGAVEGAA